MFKKYKMLEDDYGFYIDLDDNNIINENKKKYNYKKYIDRKYIEERYNEEIELIDHYENKYYKNRNNLEHKWSIIESIQCFWFVIQAFLYRYIHNNNNNI